MSELAQMETPKNAGFVQPKGGSIANKKRIEQNEAELKSLMEAKSDGQEESNSEGITAAQVQNEGSSKQEEANSESEAQEESLSGEERTYKKRYNDLRTHLNKQAEELKAIKEQLGKAQEGGTVRPPTSDESIEAWAKKYPEIAGIVETIAEKKAQEKFSYADERLQQLDKMNADAQRTKAENEIRTMHSDFDDLRGSDEFHDWANEQPKWVQDALYENQEDPKSVIRVIDLFKVDNGMDVKGKQRKSKDAASAVVTKRTTKPDNNNPAGHIRESQVQRMTAHQYEANSDAIMDAIRSGKFIYDISGGAR
mgnify:FL=1|tara:strand:- start:1199 stop:2128 length:930 start_codon:yes stop_codon:yes gene_type:complete